MAKSAATGFSFRRSLMGVEHPGTQDFILAGSATVKIGDAVRLNTNGLLVRAATGEPVLGILEGIVDQNGINAFSPRASGTTGATLTPDDQVVTSATNASDATRKLKGRVILDPAGYCLFYNDSDSTLSQTHIGQMFDAANGNQITVGGASDSNGQFQLVAIDPDNDADASKGLFRIVETQLGVGLDEATAKVGA